MFGEALGGLASGAMSIAGGLIQNSANKNAADRANNFTQSQNLAAMEFNKAEAIENRLFQDHQARQQMDFQTTSANTAMGFAERMANTQFQRGMADMKSAGLNPILAYQKGGNAAPVGVSQSGASGGGGQASAPTGAGQRAQMENVLGPAVSSAAQGARTVAELQNLAATLDQTRANTDLVRANARNVDVNTGLQTAQTITETGRPDLVRAQVNQSRAQAGQASATARLHHTEADVLPERAGASIARDRAAAGASQAQETSTRQDTELTGRYGRSRFSPAEAVGQPVQDIGRAFMDFLRSIR